VAALSTAAIALVTAAAVVAGRGGEAYWLCVPAALVAAASCRTRRGAGIGAASVIAAAVAPTLAFHSLVPVPSPILALLVPSASVGALRVVQERLQRERDAMHSSAHTDPLTGAENRRALVERIEYEIVRHTRSGASFALVMLDVDGFKLLNDRFGHAAGDELLYDLATALKRYMRSQDTVARIGGDEFCVLAPETDQAGVPRLLARIGDAVGGVTAGLAGLEASVGAGTFPADGLTSAELMNAADQRLLGAKRAVHQRRRYRRAA
jgi:diguanylate cyclase (GGDEF)-like protein